MASDHGVWLGTCLAPFAVATTKQAEQWFRVLIPGITSEKDERFKHEVMDWEILAEAAVLSLPQLPCNQYLLTGQLYKSCPSFCISKSSSEMFSCRMLLLLLSSNV